MQIELIKDWRGYRVGARFPMDVIGGGVADVLLRNEFARLLPADDSAGQGSGDPPYDPNRYGTDSGTGNDRGSQSTATHRGKRR